MFLTALGLGNCHLNGCMQTMIYWQNYLSRKAGLIPLININWQSSIVPASPLYEENSREKISVRLYFILNQM